MKDNEVIAELTKENMELKGCVKNREKSLSDIHSVLYCIGGPLNDNVYRYTKQQLKPFWKIKEIINLT